MATLNPGKISKLRSDVLAQKKQRASYIKKLREAMLQAAGGLCLAEEIMAKLKPGLFGQDALEPLMAEAKQNCLAALQLMIDQ